MKHSRPDGPICDNCNAIFGKEQVRGRETCPNCDYPFIEYQTPLHTGSRNTLDDYVDLGECENRSEEHR